MLDNMAKNLGFIAERVFTKKTKTLVATTINTDLNHIKVQARHTGTAKGRGASDTEFLFTKDGLSIAIGATIKTRAGIKNNKKTGQNDIVSKFGSTSGSDKKTFQDAFEKQNGSDMILPIDNETVEWLKYILVNF